MEIKLTGNLKMETEVPMLKIEEFQFYWKTGSHAILNVKGYIDINILWRPNHFTNSWIKIWLIDNGKIQTIFNGCLININIGNIGNTSPICIEAISASYLLDQKYGSRSFQNPMKTFGEVVREIVQAEGGQVIRNQDSDKKIQRPVFCYEETAWQFANRMGSRSGNEIIPDIETGKPNIWFGMRKGMEIPGFQQEADMVSAFPLKKRTGISFQVNDNKFYKIGEWTTYFKQKVTIVEVEGNYKNGELFFTYGLRDKAVCAAVGESAEHQAGYGIWGVIKEVKEESVKMALDIDQGENTGDYFYPWSPEHGTAIQAPPEAGARALLYFYKAGEREAAVIRCENRGKKKGPCSQKQIFQDS